AALMVALPGCWPALPRDRRAMLLMAGGGLGLVAIGLQGLAIGIQGWSWPWLEALLGALGDRQFGIGLGGTLAVVAFLVL
ncbi:hypothetical protein ABTE11_23280, partial [Acinetobacter baumannii]